MAWLEAMASGKPVVAYDLPWAREILEPGRSGMLVAPGAARDAAVAIDALLADPTFAARLGGAARQRVERHFSAEEIAVRSITWYRRVLESRSARHPGLGRRRRIVASLLGAK